MKTKKLVLKIAYCFVGLLILVSLGFNIFQYQRNKKLSKIVIPEKIAKNESFSETNIASKSAPVKIVQKNKEEKFDTGAINELEDHLSTAEKVLDKASEQLSEELSKKAEYKKVYDQYRKNMKKDPVLQKIINDGLKHTLIKNYAPLFNKLAISKEEFEELKDMLLDQQEEIRATKPSNILTATDEENMKMQQQRKDIRDKYDKVISESLEKENFHIYSSYQKSLSERSGLNQFMERILPDNKISEEETEILINSMYAAREAVFNEMGPDIDMNLSSNLTKENIALQNNKVKLVFDKYVEASRSILPEEQVEQYKIFLKGNLDMNKASMKRRLYMKNK